MRLTLIIWALVLSVSCIGQSYRKVQLNQDEYAFYQLPGAKEKIKGIQHIEVFIAIDNTSDYEDTVFIIGIYPDLKKKTEIQILLGYSAGENLFINTAKMYDDPWYSNDTIYLKSQMPYRATYVTCPFVWSETNKMFEPVEVFYEDESWKKMSEADSLIKLGKISEAIEILHTVEYPTAYMNEYEKGKEIMKRAHEIALKLHKENKWKEAAGIIESGLQFWTNDLYINFNNESELSEFLQEGYGEKWTRDEVKLWLGDYGLFLYKAGLLDKSIEINKYLTEVLSETAGPGLQLADSYYDKGDKLKAKEAYKNYYQKMKELKKEKEVPKRVKQRMK